MTGPEFSDDQLAAAGYVVDVDLVHEAAAAQLALSLPDVDVAVVVDQVLVDVDEDRPTTTPVSDDQLAVVDELLAGVDQRSVEALSRAERALTEPGELTCRRPSCEDRWSRHLPSGGACLDCGCRGFRWVPATGRIHWSEASQ